MKVTMLTVGKTDMKWVKEGLEMYVFRLRHYINFVLVEIPELRNAGSLTRDMIKEKEGELILKNLKAQDELVLLDERGKEFRSVEFARSLGDRMSRGARDVVFVIGGAYGFSDDVYARADSMLSLSRMTFSHQIVRVIFAEQLYRAFTIIKGEPYHHE